jgi:signal transduction histidine kinase
MSDTPILDLEAKLAAASTPPVDPVQRIDALTELAWELRSADIPRANALATEARDLAIKQTYKLGQARAARTMAMTIADAAGLRMMFQLAEEAKTLFDEVDDGPGRAASRDFLASLHEHIGDFAGGLEFALDALTIARDIGDPIRQGYALSSVGGILAASGEIDVAVERLQEALKLFENEKDPTGVGVICSRLSEILENADRDAEALAYAKICRDTAESTQDEYLNWAALTVMAELEQKKGNLLETERLYRAALDSFSESPTGRSVIGSKTQIALGRLLIKRGALSDAEFELNDALARIEGDSVSIVAEAAAHEGLAELRECQEEYPSAIVHLRKAQTLREKISQRDASNRLTQVETRAAMAASKKDAEIHKLRFVELHGMQSKLVEAEKMAFLGRLAAGTAHEFNTPLGVLRNNTNLASTAIQRLISILREQGELEVQATKLASVLKTCSETNAEAMERITSIVQSLRRFTELDLAELRAFDVSEGVDSALVLLKPTIPEGIKLERRFENVPKIEGWPRELNHAFMTVLQNAAQAISGEGVITVETRATADTVLVRVIDTGRGMSEEQAAHIFDVAWAEDGIRTTMRLGLSAAYSTVQKHGGTIEVQSVVGQGTTVTFSFPIPTGTP